MPDSTSQSVCVLVNGQPHELPHGATLADLLRRLDMAERPLAVELNFHVVPRAQHATTHLHEGDQLEVVALVGGG